MARDIRCALLLKNVVIAPIAFLKISVKAIIRGGPAAALMSFSAALGSMSFGIRYRTTMPEKWQSANKSAQLCLNKLQNNVVTTVLQRR
jgi:hypothetical protein